MSNLTCYSVSFQFYLFTIGVLHQLIENGEVYYEASNSFVETGLSLSVVYNNNMSDRSRKIRISSSLDEVDLLHIIDTNNTNTIVLNLNTIQDILSVVTFMTNSFSIFSSSPGPTTNVPVKSSSVDIIEICFPAVVLRYSLYNSIFFFISIENMNCSLRHTACNNSLLCDFGTSVQYEMDSPLQYILNKVAFHIELNTHEKHIVASASLDRSISSLGLCIGNVMVNFPSEILLAINRNKNNKSTNDPSAYSFIKNNTGVKMQVEGEDKNGNVEFICNERNQESAKKGYNLSKYNYLILTLSTPLGSYLPCRIPIHAMNNQEKQEQSKIVNFSLQGETELEDNLEQIFTFPEKQSNPRSHRLLSLLQNSSINVQYLVCNNECTLEISSTTKIENNMDIPIFVTIFFGHALLYSCRIEAFSSSPVPPFAYLLSHLHVIIVPITFSIEEQLIQSPSDISDILPKFAYSSISIGVTGIQDGLYKCINQNVVHEVEVDNLCYLRELVDSLYLYIQLRKGLNSNYVLSLSAPITVINQLPMNLDFVSTFNHTMQSGSQLSLYDMDFQKELCVTPLRYETKNSLSLQELCGTAIQALESNQYVKNDEVKMCFECVDKNNNTVWLNCLLHWENDALQLCFYVPYWIVNLTGDPIQFKSSIKETTCLIPNQLNYSIAEKTRFVNNMPVFGLEWLCKNEEEILLLNHDDTLLLRGIHTFWSSSINYKSLSISREVALTDRSSLLHTNSFIYHYIMESSHHSSIYSNTKVLSLVNQFCIYNNTTIPIEFKQVDCPDDFRTILSPFEVKPIQLYTGTQPSIVIRLLNTKSYWSYSSIPIVSDATKKKDTLLLYCKDTVENHRHFFEVTIDYQYNGCVNYVINESTFDENNLPVIFNNHTIFPITLQQKDCDDTWDCPPFKIIPLYWGNAAKKHFLQLRIFNRGITNIDTSIPLYDYMLNCNQSKNRIVIRFNNPSTTQVCALSINVELLKNKLFISVKHRSTSFLTSLPTVSEGRYTEVLPRSEQTTFHLEVKVPSVHMSLLSISGIDLFCLNFNDMLVQMKLDDRKDLSCAIQDIQMDNQLVQSHYPTVLSIRGTPKKPSLYIHCALQEEDSVEFGNCLFVSIMEVDLQPIHIVLESIFVDHCLALLKELRSSSEATVIMHYDHYKPQTVCEYMNWLRNHRNQFITAYPYSEIVRTSSPIISHRQIYEESKHIRVKKIVLSDIDIHTSLSLGTVFSSWYYDYYSFQDLPIHFPSVLLQEKYPRRISYVMSQLKSVYLRSSFIQFLRIIGSFKLIGNPTRVLTDFKDSFQTLFSECLSSITNNQPLLAIPMVINSLTNYIDRNLNSLSLVFVDSISSLLSSATMFFQLLHSSTRSYIYHGEVTQYSPYIHTHKKGYHYIPYLLRQGRSLLIHALYHVSLLSYPLQYLLKELQDFGSTLHSSSISKQRVKSPNISIGGIMMVSVHSIYNS